MKIKIGADEIILWLRKNNKAVSIPNDGFGGLGQKIHDLICSKLNGSKINDNDPVYWESEISSKNIGEFNLPKTSAQYEIEISRLSDLYSDLNLW